MDAYKHLVDLATPIIGMAALFIFQKISSSVNKLNENVAVVIERIEQHDEAINENKLANSKSTEDLADLKLNLAKKGII